MPTKRKNRARSRIAPLSAAEWEWVTGEPQEGVNEFERLDFLYPCEPRHFDRLDAVLDRAVGAVAAERIADRRAYVRELRAEDRRKFPQRPAYLGARIFE